MKRPIACVVGFIGKLPYAGMSFYNLHYIAGLQALGYDVHYIERQNIPDECYDPNAGTMTDETGYALNYLQTVLPGFDVKPERFSFIDCQQKCHGSGWPALR